MKKTLIIIGIVLCVLVLCGSALFLWARKNGKIDNVKDVIVQVIDKVNGKNNNTNNKKNNDTKKEDIDIVDDEPDIDTGDDVTPDQGSGENVTDNQVVNQTPQEIAMAIFKNYLESQGDLAEYKIISVELDSEEKRSASTEFFKATKDAIFAEAKFSVKPKNMTDSPWVDGNGTQEGEWINNKDIKIYLDLNEEGNYDIKSMGTGW